MRRFLFPIEFVVVFVAVQFVFKFAQNLLWGLIRLDTDVYFIQQNSLSRFIPSALFGLVVGYIFTSLDFVFNSRGDPTAKITQQRLVRYGARSGLCAIGFWLFWNFGVMRPLFNHYQHRRYHAYAPDMAWLNIAGNVQFAVFVGLLLWALGCSLNHRSTQLS